MLSVRGVMKESRCEEVHSGESEKRKEMRCKVQIDEERKGCKCLT